MKTFKQFFEDVSSSADQIGNVDIYAKEPNKEIEPLGQVSTPDKVKISKYIGKVAEDGDTLIQDLIKDSEFDTIQYHRSFRAILDEHDINWPVFRKHVKNRFKTGLKLTNYFKGSAGQVDFVRVFKPITDSLLVNPDQDGDNFFKEIFTLNHSIGNTAVGDGEFLLGIIGNGVKGKTGDVDVLRLTKKGSTALEVGTWSKIIGASSREKNRKGIALELLQLAVNNRQDTWTPETFETCERLLQNFKTLTPEHIQYVIDLIVTNSGTKYGPFTPLNRIIGSVVLYDYILDHGDNFVVIINYSSGGADSPKMTKARSDLGLYNARFCNPARLGLEGTINLSLEKNYFGFSIDKSAVRVQLGL